MLAREGRGEADRRRRVARRGGGAARHTEGCSVLGRCRPPERQRAVQLVAVESKDDKVLQQLQRHAG